MAGARGTQAVRAADAAPPSTEPATARPSRRTSRVDLALVGIVALGAVLRLWSLGRQSLWYDEWMTAEAIGDGWRDLASNVANRDGLPLPYFVILWPWSRLFGVSEAALRLPSALAGIAAIPSAYAACRELRLPRATGRLAALLVAVHPTLVWYSQEVRSYSFLALFGALSIWAVARVLSDGTTRSYLLWGAVGAGLVGAHYYGTFLVVAGAAALLLLRGHEWRRLAVGSVPVVVMLALLAPIATRQRANDPGRWIDSFALADRLEDAGRSALDGPNPVRASAWIVVLAVVAIAGVLAVRADPVHRRAAAVAGAVGGGAAGLAVAADVLHVNAFVSRYLLASLVPLIIAAAAALTALGRRVATVGACLVVGILLATTVVGSTDAELQKPGWREVAEIAATGRDDRVLVVDTHRMLAQPLLHYLDAARPLGPDEQLAVEQIDIVVVERMDARCNFLVGRACALLFLGAPLPAPLADRFTLERTYELDQFIVERYTARSPVVVRPGDLVPPDSVPTALLIANGAG
jgi:4-amino-4-deoxy-L-arabinose transferase-like glycosyltransferase